MKARLVPRTLADTQALLAGMSPEDMATVSVEWRARVESADPADPWVHGFSFACAETGEVVGQGGFRRPPDEAGCVEIAYGIRPEFQGKGWATAGTRELVGFVLASGRVRRILAHTLEVDGASARVLTKVGFRLAGQVVDPEDGPVWRWEYLGAPGADGERTH